MIKKLTKISSPVVSLIFVLLLISGCAVGGPGGGAAPAVGGGAANASGDKTVPAGSDGSGDNSSAAPGGDPSSSSGGSASDNGANAGVPKFTDGSGIIYDKPLPMLPAPGHEFPHTLPAVVGRISACRTEDNVMLTLAGFVGRYDYPGGPYMDYANDYTFEVNDKIDGSATIKSPLQSHAADGAANVVRTGYVDIAVPLSREKYPNNLFNLDFLIRLNPKRAMDLSQNDPSVPTDKTINVYPMLLNIPHDPSHMPECPLVKDPALLGYPNTVEFEGAEKALTSP